MTKQDETLAAARKSRRGFLKAGTAAAVAGAALAMPNVSRAQTVTLKIQGSWGAKDVFNEMAEDYVKRVNDMGGGRLKLDYLIAGAVVHAFSVQDAVHKGVLDGAHTVPVYWYGKHKAASLFGSGPVLGYNANHCLGWIHNGGGYALYLELVQQVLKQDIVGFFAMPMPTQPLGWFKKEIKSAADIRGLKYRTVGLAADLFQEMGAAVSQLPGGEIVPAMERGRIDAFEFNNPTSDRRFGAQDVAKIYMMGSHHQAMEFFEVMFNKTKYDALPKEHQAILKYAAEAASSANEWKAYDYYSTDLIELQEKDKVKVIRTPKDVFDAQIKAWDVLVKKLEEDPYTKKVIASQRAWAKRVGYYHFLNETDYRGAYEHHFGKLPI